MTPTEEISVLADLRAGKDVIRTAKFWGVPLRDVRELAGRISIERTILARDDISQYAIATKRVDAEWPDIPEIKQARDDYEAGLVEMATGRSHNDRGHRGPTQTLYVFPRRSPVKNRNPWFSRIEE